MHNRKQIVYHYNYLFFFKRYTMAHKSQNKIKSTDENLLMEVSVYIYIFFAEIFSGSFGGYSCNKTYGKNREIKTTTLQTTNKYFTI